MSDALLELTGLSKRFAVRRGWLRREAASLAAVDDVELTLAAGECFALVGESGSGKTTLARMIMRLLPPTSGGIRFAGEDLLGLSGEALRRRRRDFQMVFQDPFGSLDPRSRVGWSVGEPLAAHGIGTPTERRRRVAELFDLVGLPAEAADRYPHEFSGGQRQRLGIARALATGPRLLVADEPVSALDVSVRAQVLNLLADLQRRLGLTLLLIAHDLALVEQIADRVGVMYMGRLVELAPTRALFADPQHPYTASLLASVPIADPHRRGRDRRFSGEIGSLLEPPPGCVFHPRCPIATDECRRDRPPLAPVAPERAAACFHPGEIHRSPPGGSGTFAP